MSLDDLKRSVARTSGVGKDTGIPSGTAFLVTGQLALTCAHCVVDDGGKPAERINLHFSLWTDERDRIATPEYVDTQRDVALLRLEEPVQVAPCPRAGNARQGERWQAFGHPSPTHRNGLAISGHVEDPHGRVGVEVTRDVMQLTCRAAEDSLKGASGSPVYVDGRIVGMISNQALMWTRAPDGRKDVKPSYGTLYAVPVEQIASSPQLRSVIEWVTSSPDTAPQEAAKEENDAALLRRYHELVESIPKLCSIKMPGRNGAIETLPLASVYVEPELKGLNELDEIWHRQRVAVIGAEGSGKGALLKHLNLELLRKAEEAPERAPWPLHVQLDQFARHDGSGDLVGFAIDTLLGPGDNDALRDRLTACHREGRLVLLCDGLDDVGPHYERILDTLGRQRRFVVTLRPAQNVDVGQESGGTLRLQPFDRRRVAAFVTRWSESMTGDDSPFDVRRTIQEIGADGPLFELARTPRFLALICSVMSGGESIGPTRTGLIAAAWAGVWKASFGNEPYLRRRAVSRSLEGLAATTFTHGPGINEFDEDAIYERLDSAGEKDPDAVVSRLIEREIVVPTRDSGYASRTFTFPLDSFQTYLAAEHLAQDDDFLLGLEGLELDSRWSRILPLVAGVLGRDEGRLDALRNFLTTIVELPSREALGMHVRLAADCLYEVHPDAASHLAPLRQRVAEEMLRICESIPAARGQLLRCIERMQPPEVRRAMLAIADDRERPTDQRAFAMLALCTFPDEDRVERVVRVARDDQAAQLRAGACLVLALLEGDRIGPALVESLKDPELSVRVTAAQCIGRRRDCDVADLVLEAWLDSEPRRASLDNQFLGLLASAAWTSALVGLRPEATLPLLLGSLTRAEQAEYAEVVLSILAEVGHRAAVWPGVMLLEDDGSPPNVRQAAAQMLLRLGTEAALYALEQAFSRNDDAAKVGAFFGFSVVESMRQLPVAELFIEPADASLTWSLMRSVEREIFDAQITALERVVTERAGGDPQEAVAQAREVLANAPHAAPRGEDQNLMSDLVKMFAGADEGMDRLAAFETVQMLEGDPDLLLEALFDPDARLAARASVWMRSRRVVVPAEPLLVRLDAGPMRTSDFGFAAAINALAQPEHLEALLARYRCGSRSAALGLWNLGVQYGCRFYEDGRIELPDGRIDADAGHVVRHLVRLDEASAGQPAHPGLDRDLAWRAAEEEYRAALEQRPRDAAGWASLAVLAVHLDEMDTAKEALRAATNQEPDRALWWRFRGWLAQAMDEAETAIEHLLHARSLDDSSPELHMALANALHTCERFEDAVGAYSDALDRNPDCVDARIGRARCLFVANRGEDALEDLDPVLEAQPGNTQAAVTRAYVNAALGRHEAAAGDLDAVDAMQAQGVAMPADEVLWEAYLIRSRQRLAGGDPDAGHGDAKRVIIAQPLHPVARVLRARAWIQQGHPGFAVVDLVDLVGRTAEGEARDALARALDELLELFGVDASAPLPAAYDADARGVRGVVLERLGDIEHAREDLEYAASQGNRSWQVLHTLARLLLHEPGAEPERASLLATRALEGLDDDPLAGDAEHCQVLDTLGCAFIERGMVDEARDALDRAVALCPDDETIGGHRARIQP